MVSEMTFFYYFCNDCLVFQHDIYYFNTEMRVMDNALEIYIKSGWPFGLKNSKNLEFL